MPRFLTSHQVDLIRNNKCITSDKRYDDDEFRTHIDWARPASNNYFKLCKNGSIAGVVIRIGVFLIPTESVANEGLYGTSRPHWGWDRMNLNFEL